MIEVGQLSKYYDERAAISNLSFSIGRGEVIGFLGLNGAGKTTTLRILGCVLLPTSGTVRIDGNDVVAQPHEIRKRIGFLPDTPPLYDEMTVGAYLGFVARLRGVAEARIAASSRRPREDRAARGPRGGDREPLARLPAARRRRPGHRAQADAAHPRRADLGPGPGADRRDARAHPQLKGQHTILVSSHILSEISQTCDRLLVIHDGKLVAQGSESDLSGGKHRRQRDRGDRSRRARRRCEALAAIRGLPTVKSAGISHEESGSARLVVEAPASLRPQIVRALVAADVDLLRIDYGAPELESIFLQLTRTGRPRKEDRHEHHISSSRDESSRPTCARGRGYVIIAVMLAVDGLLFNAFVLGGVDKRSSEVLGHFFQVSSIIVMIASVFVSMRLIAEERQTGTINLLYASPISDRQIVLGKYLSALAFLASSRSPPSTCRSSCWSTARSRSGTFGGLRGPVPPRLGLHRHRHLRLLAGAQSDRRGGGVGGAAHRARLPVVRGARVRATAQ